MSTPSSWAIMCHTFMSMLSRAILEPHGNIGGCMLMNGPMPHKADPKRLKPYVNGFVRLCNGKERRRVLISPTSLWHCCKTRNECSPTYCEGREAFAAFSYPQVIKVALSRPRA